LAHDSSPGALNINVEVSLMTCSNLFARARTSFLFAMLVLFTGGVASAQFVHFKHPQPGDRYKEFSRVMTSYKDWRVTDPTTTDPRAQANLPNATLSINISDLQGATRAEALIDFCHHHWGTTNKKIRFNGRPWIDIPEIQTTPVSGKCYSGQTVTVVNVPLADLVQGNNTFTGTNEMIEDCSDFSFIDWGQSGMFGIVIRIYYSSSKGGPTGSITSPSSNGSFGENPTISATASSSAGIAKVDFIAYYEGPDVDGDGIHRDWQYHYHRDKSQTSMFIRNHVGTDASSPYSVTWNTEWVPDQPAGGIKLLARIQDNNGIWYVTPEVSGLTLNRSNSSVKLYKSTGVPQRFQVSGRRLTRSCTINIPTGTNVGNATSARLYVQTWNGTNKQALAGEDGYTKFNNQQFSLYGQDEHWSGDVLTVRTSELKVGANTFLAYSESSGFGIAIQWPGPDLVVRYGSAPPPPGPATKLVFDTQPTSTAAGATISPAVTVRIEDANGNLITGDTRNVTIAIGTNPAGGTLNGTKTVAAVGGIATFSTLSINNAGNGYTLVATASGLTSATSTSFNITGGTTPGTPTKLAFGTQPSNTLAGATITPAVTVRIEDANGTLVTSDTRSVTVAIGTNPAGGTLNGTKTVNAVGGIATFSGLSINNAGNGYTLTASASGLTGATSNAFNVTTSTPPPPTGNLLSNGGFEEGTTGWRHFADGGPTNAFSVVTTSPVAEGTRKGRVVLDPTIGSNNQLYYKDLKLDAGVGYTLTFQAYASKNTNIQVRVIEQDDDYTTYGFPFQTVALTTGFQTFTIQFTAGNFTGSVTDAMLQLYFVKSQPSTTLYFDAVSISSGSMPPPPANNILVNGSFESDKTAWKHFANGGATNAFNILTSAPIADGSKKAQVVLDASIGTNNQIYQKDLALTAGTKYTLTFSAYASKTTTMQVRVIEQDEDYTVYGFPFQTINLTTGFQSFTVDFTAGNFAGTVTDAMVQFYFVNSSPSTSIYLDKVVLGPVMTSGPSELPTVEKSGEGVTPEAATAALPTELGLRQNYPNPFNPSTQIEYTLPAASHVTLEVYNLLGERVATLVDEAQPAGYFSARFDAGALPSGLYFYRLTTNSTSLIKKMMFVK
jgi:hypothetical protein